MSRKYENTCQFDGCKVDLDSTNSTTYYCPHHMKVGVEAMDMFLKSSTEILEPSWAYRVKQNWKHSDIIGGRLVFRGRTVENKVND